MDCNLQLAIEARIAERAAALGVSSEYGMAALRRIITRRVHDDAAAAQQRMHARAMAEEATTCAA